MARKNHLATIINRRPVWKLFQLSNGDFISFVACLQHLKTLFLVNNSNIPKFLHATLSKMLKNKVTVYMIKIDESTEMEEARVSTVGVFKESTSCCPICYWKIIYIFFFNCFAILLKLEQTIFLLFSFFWFEKLCYYFLFFLGFHNNGWVKRCWFYFRILSEIALLGKYMSV